MTVALLARVRLAAHLPVYGGVCGTVVGRTTLSRRWIVTLDVDVWPGQHGQDVCSDDELTVLDGNEREGEAR